MKNKESNYEPYYTLEVTGQIIGLMACKRCGATVIIANDTKADDIHDKWHMYLLTSRKEE